MFICASCARDNKTLLKNHGATNGSLYLIWNLHAGGELFDRIVDAPNGHFTEKDASTIMRQLMGALAYLHSKGIVHRSVGPVPHLYV
jgi:calcium/calmodulin-dependent protein kinase I